MPLNIASVAVPVEPAGIDSTEVAPGRGSGGVPPGQAAQVRAIPLSGLEVQIQLPPVIDAGVKLAKLVLYIAAGSIVVLIVYLISMDLVIGSDIHKSYDHILNPSRIGSEFYMLGRLEQLSVDLSAARKDPAVKLSAESLQNAESILKTVDALPSVTTTQKDRLAACIPLPEANDSRNGKLDLCISIIENIRQAALEAAAGTTNAQVASDAVTKTNEHRQSLHTFWIQAAQLILLNLLLPLLTALFGYIFGTQQAQRATQ